MAAVEGDFDAFCRREYSRLVGALSLYCGDAGLAEEFAQVALARAYERWPEVRTATAPGAWAYRVAVNAANSWFRRRRAEARARARHGDPQRLPSDAPEPADSVAIRQAVAQLPPPQRAVITLRFFYDLPVATVAAMLRTTEGAVKQHSTRAMASLRNRLRLESPCR